MWNYRRITVLYLRQDFDMKICAGQRLGIAKRPHGATMRLIRLCLVISLLAASPALAYKGRPFSPRPIGEYPAALASEGLTIGVSPLYSDSLAAKVFDIRDMVKRGIMPLLIIISNDNDFAVDIDGFSVELQLKGNRIAPVGPDQAVIRLFARSRTNREVRVPSPVPFPRVAVSSSDRSAYDDFGQKHLGMKRVEAKSTAWGFIYVPAGPLGKLPDSLSEARVYIPELRRVDNKHPLMFFEIDIAPAIDSTYSR